MRGHPKARGGRRAFVARVLRVLMTYTIHRSAGRRPQWGQPMKRVFAISGLVLVGLFVSPLNAGSLKHRGPGCKNSDLLRQFIRIVRQEDNEAINKWLEIHVLNGDCIMLDKGQEIFRAQTPFFSDYMCVRPKGEPECVWINKGHFAE